MGVSVVGAHRKLGTVFNFVQVMKGYIRNVGLIGENQREFGLRTGDHESQMCRRKDTSTLFRKINFFDFIRRAYRNSTWKPVIQYNFWLLSQICEKLLITSSCLPVRLSAWNISGPSIRILVFIIFLENMSRKFKFH